MSEQEHENRTMGGYKAALHNPNVSGEAKRHAAEVLVAHGEVLPEDAADLNKKTSPPREEESEKHRNRVIGGYKAALHNPNNTAETKRHAGQILQDNGVSLTDEDKAILHQVSRSGVHPPDLGSSAEGQDVEHEHRVLGGYKATLTDPNTSEEAKEHARQMIAEIENDRARKGEYKAMVPNPPVFSEKALARARETINRIMEEGVVVDE